MRKATPSGMKATPMANMNGSTLVAVMTGCHAGNVCCLNFVSRTQTTHLYYMNKMSNCFNNNSLYHLLNSFMPCLTIFQDSRNLIDIT